MFKDLSIRTKVLILLFITVVLIGVFFTFSSNFDSGTRSFAEGGSPSPRITITPSCPKDITLSSELNTLNQNVLQVSPPTSISLAVQQSIDNLANSQAPIREVDYADWERCTSTPQHNCSDLRQRLVRNALGDWMSTGTQPIRVWLNTKLGLMKGKNYALVGENLDEQTGKQGSAGPMSLNKIEAVPKYSVGVQPVIRGVNFGARLDVQGYFNIGSSIVKASAGYNQCLGVLGTESSTGQGGLTEKLDVKIPGQALWFSFEHSDSDLISKVQLTGAF